MKISIIGYGVMGKLIEKAILEKGFEIASIIDPVAEGATHKEINKESLKNTNVCIDFTVPAIAIENIKKIATLKVNIVMGTTGWYYKMDEVKKIVKENGIGFIWSGNFSIGVNAFFKIIKDASKVMNNLNNYDVYAYEQHHHRKKDSPSGTAEMIGSILLDNIERKKSIVTERLDRPISADEIHLGSIRGGDIPGIHTVGFDSTFDTIELKHTARSREGFAQGSVLAAEFLHKKKGFYDINDLMDNIIGK